MVISKTELRNRRSQTQCLICHHPDRAWIETLLAAGVFCSDVAEEFGLQERTLRRHDAFHSVTLPDVDPLSILRSIRWLNEQSTLLTQTLLRSGAGQKRSKEIYKLRMEAIRTTLGVLSEYAKLTDVRKHMDPHVTLQRWHEVMTQIFNGLQDIPQAREALLKVIEDEGPKDSPDYVKMNKKFNSSIETGVEQLSVSGNGEDTAPENLNE